MTLESLALVILEASPLCGLVRRSGHLWLTSPTCSPLPAPVISQSVHCISLDTMLGLGYLCDPATQGFQSNLFSSFLLDFRPKLLSILQLFICLLSGHFSIFPVLYCKEYISQPPSLTGLSHVWLTGGTGRKLVLGGGDKPEHLSSFLSASAGVFSSSCISSVMVTTTKQIPL